MSTTNVKTLSCSVQLGDIFTLNKLSLNTVQCNSNTAPIYKLQRHCSPLQHFDNKL